MSTATTAVSLTLAIIFTAVGTAKVLAVPAMQARAAHVGLSVDAYRRIGLLELLGAGGLLAGLHFPLLGMLAAGGLALLMLGALATHVRLGDAARDLAPAAVLGLLATLCVVLPIASS